MAKAGADKSKGLYHGDPHLPEFVAEPSSQDNDSLAATYAGKPFGSFDTDLRRLVLQHGA